MKFEIDDIDALGRIGSLIVNDRKAVTPNLFPVVHPYKNIISTLELKKIGAQCIFTNAYIIYQNEILRNDVLKKGIHHHLNFEGIIATDSGAFQQYMYNNSQIDINAETIEKFQEDIGSDFPVILDIPVNPVDNHEIAKDKVLTTIQRAKDNINRRTSEECHWFGPIHGAKYLDLIKLSAIEMNKLEFDIYAIGGLVKTFLDYRFDLSIQILLTAKKYLIPSKPIHIFGLGLPLFFSLAVACGCDLMDSAAYILYAKENRYFSLSTGTKKLDELKEFPCHCPICCEYNPKEVKKLDENLRIKLLAKHNLYISFSELKTIRQAIREGNLWELVEQRIRNHPALVEAVKIIKAFKSLFENHEKIYKNHGRLYASSESIYRPMLYRYEQKLINNYRVPKEANFLIILPELDTRYENSPMIKKWLNKINNNTIIPRKYLHIVFLSIFYGIIPFELSQIFQYESITPSGRNDLLYNNSLKKSEVYFFNHIKNYEKCGILIPKKYINQFEEVIEFSANHPVNGLISILESKFSLKISNFNNLEDLLRFFEDDK